MANPIMNARMYARITGIALAAVAVLGIVMSLTVGADADGNKAGLFCSEPSATTCSGTAADNSFLAFDWVHNGLHAILALVALAVGYATMPTNYVKYYAIAFGAVYLGLAITGFIAPKALDTLGIHLELGENLVHAVIGAWGLVVGFFGTVTTTTTPTTTGTPTAGRRN